MLHLQEMRGGTLNQVTIKNDTKKDVTVIVDFLMTVTKGHLLAAACTILGVQSLTLSLQFLLGISKCSYSEQYAYVQGIATAVVEQCTLADVSFVGSEVDDQNDLVHIYTEVLCHFGSHLMGQKVTVKEYCRCFVCLYHLDVQSIL